jgi:hypothetical protein
LALEDKAGVELTAQAVRIGEQLVSWAREINSQKRVLAQYGPDTLGRLEFRSHCYGHPLHPVQTIQAEDSQDLPSISFDYEYGDYYAAPRSEAESGTPGSEDTLLLTEGRYEQPDVARLLPATDSDRTTLRFSLEVEGREFSVDFDQLFRGHRFLYRPQGNGSADVAFAKRASIGLHQASDILAHSGLVTNADGIHFIPTGGNELIRWVLLGKLYPENVVLLDKGDREELEAAYVSGKGFGTQFLVL